MVVLGPPTFAKSRSSVDDALRGYKDINHHVSEALLLEAIAEASLDARKPLRVLERRTQARDHPILLTVPHGRKRGLAEMGTACLFPQPETPWCHHGLGAETGWLSPFPTAPCLLTATEPRASASGMKRRCG
jgi:hypothetical protein